MMKIIVIITSIETSRRPIPETLVALFPRNIRRGNATHAPQVETRLIKISKVGII